MNATEFDMYWSDFSAKFPGKAKYVQDFGSDVLAQWAVCMDKVELCDALTVNSRIFRGELAHILDGWDMMPALIRDAARPITFARKMASAEESDGLCGNCRDSGYVECWHPDSIVAVSQGKKTGRNYTMAVPCNCHRGNQFATWNYVDKREPKELPRFDPAKFCRESDSIMDWLQHHGHQVAGHNAALDQFDDSESEVSDEDIRESLAAVRGQLKAVKYARFDK